jgi:hypothetical protein
MKEIEVGKIYRHYKGKLVKVICIGLNTETKEKMIAIEELEPSQGYPKGQVWFRNIEDFFDEVNMNGQKYRFELI